MISEDKLVGWLCIFRSTTGEEGCNVFVPDVVIAAWIERGWVARSGRNWDGVGFVDITPIGNTLCDLHSGDWGISLELV